MLRPWGRTLTSVYHTPSHYHHYAWRNVLTYTVEDLAVLAIVSCYMVDLMLIADPFLFWRSRGPDVKCCLELLGEQLYKRCILHHSNQRDSIKMGNLTKSKKTQWNVYSSQGFLRDQRQHGHLYLLVCQYVCLPGCLSSSLFCYRFSLYELKWKRNFTINHICPYYISLMNMHNALEFQSVLFLVICILGESNFTGLYLLIT